MKPREAHETEQLVAQIAPVGVAALPHATELEGHGVGEFVDVAQQAAGKTIEDPYVIRLTAEGQLRFAQLLLDPPSLTPAMERAIAAHARLMRE